MKKEIHKFSNLINSRIYFFNYNSYNFIFEKSIFNRNYMIPFITFRNELNKLFKQEPI